ncbi:sodium-dependent proline transporter domain protein [Teladorsagia circumcincta]|uniref:Sodium-dependent proline transporter domain protein n=1 Tax=Teladorsagia circumcincta TaxID=45464 RepID=A0A2G9UYC9_TELCI|nr:sodium-dependent proline transporter domain protein [Teladorsagia circumcincta]
MQNKDQKSWESIVSIDKKIRMKSENDSQTCRQTAFLIPYVICSVLVGLPCLYLELFIGQLTQSGPSKAFWYYMPALQGVGWAMSILGLLTGIYYNVVVAWCLRYIFDVITLQSSKWTSCDNYWNSKTCQSAAESVSNVEDNATFAAQEFFRHRLLNISTAKEETGAFNWEIFVALLTAWTITCLSLIRGVSIIGKISFLTATMPYLIIGNDCRGVIFIQVVMFIRGVTMDGAKIGIDYYLLKPDMSKVFYLKTWLEAAKQLCFSLGIGFGGLLALASFNKKDHNCFRDAVIVAMCDSLMSIIGGVAVFSTLGSLSKTSGKPIDVLFKYDAAFVIPYVVCSVLVGLPCLYLEFLIGQLTQSGPSKAFRCIMPAMQGLISEHACKSLAASGVPMK